MFIDNYTFADLTKRLQFVLYTNYLTSGNKTFTAEFRDGTVSHVHTTLLLAPIPTVKQATYYKSAVQNLTASSPWNTDITFDLSGAWNNDGGYITHVDGTTDFTVVQTGLYQLEFNATVLVNNGTWSTAVNRSIAIDITRPSIVEQGIIATTSLQGVATYAVQTSGTVYLVAGDVINCRINNAFTLGTPTPPQVNCVQSTFDLNTFFTWTFITG
jgi:hypothetical protein